MKETARITMLFDELYNGEPWIDVTLLGTLKKLTAKQAAKKISPKHNSVWEIVNHIIKWRLHLIARLRGIQLYVTDDNYFSRVSDQSDAAWKNTLKELEASQKEWTGFLKKLNDKDLGKINPNSGKTHYYHIHAIIHHDVYHLGQIVILSKSL